MTLADFISPCKRYSASFEDNGKVAYAYLKEGANIVGDVWLYNRCPTPEQPEWTDRSNIPFANCKGYMNEKGRIVQQVASNDVKTSWEYEDNVPVLYVYVFDELCGVMSVYDKPGYSRFAIKDSPIARVMEIEE